MVYRGVYVIKDFEKRKRNKKGKKGGKKGGKKEVEGCPRKTKTVKDSKGYAAEPKPPPLTAELSNPDLTTDKGGIERILKLVTVYDDPDYGGCTISGLLSNDVLLHALKRTHLLDSVLTHPCTLVAKNTGNMAS